MISPVGPTGSSCLMPPPYRAPIPAAKITSAVFIFVSSQNLVISAALAKGEQAATRRGPAFRSELVSVYHVFVRISTPLCTLPDTTGDILPKRNRAVSKQSFETAQNGIQIPTGKLGMLTCGGSGWRPGRQPSGQWGRGRGCRRHTPGRCCGRTPRTPGLRHARRRCPA